MSKPIPAQSFIDHEPTTISIQSYYLLIYKKPVCRFTFPFCPFQQEKKIYKKCINKYVNKKILRFRKVREPVPFIGDSFKNRTLLCTAEPDVIDDYFIIIIPPSTL